MACPICGSGAQISEERPAPGNRSGHLVECARCGTFFISRTAIELLPGTLNGDVEKIARLAYRVRRMQLDKSAPFLTTQLVDDLLTSPLPSVFEQANILILRIGEQAPGPGETLALNAQTDQFTVGAKSPAGFVFLVSHLLNAGYLEGPQEGGGGAHVKLTFRGWEYLAQLQRGQVESRKAFMAMRYGDATLDGIVNDFFRPAVAQTGFTLTRLDDQPRAGLIDDRLRVEIRNSRFMISDLTHDNLGAYWESGFAEGLDKPVIYTCERGKFEEAKTHFDTNHHLTVVWDAADPAAAAEQLKATIRATLPTEAKRTD